MLKIKSVVTVLFVMLSYFGMSQNAELANSYFRKGDYEKAIVLYEPLYENNPIRQDYFKSLLTCYQQIESYDKSQALIEEQILRFPQQVYLQVELGYNYQLRGQADIAEKYYNESIEYVRKNPAFVFMIGRSFRQNHLLDQALLSYKIAKELNPKLNTEISEAQIYGEKGELEKMFSLYLDLIEKNENYFSTVQRYVGNFITDDKTNKNNLLFKNLVLKRAQSDPKDAWNILLSWLFMQQREYAKAFTQEKSLFKRKPTNLQRVKEIGYLSFSNKDFETAGKAFEFILANKELVDLTKEDILLAEIYLLKIENSLIKNRKDKNKIQDKYEALILAYGNGQETLELHLSYADFLTFDYDEPTVAITNLEELLPSISSAFEKGIIQMKIADILVFTDQFNQALILYTQIQYNLKNSQIAQEARFKVARTSYFKGDFVWAQNQLKILKSSTSQLIANDALELSLTISNNLEKDSVNDGLIIFAKSELLGFQKKYEQAIDTLSHVLVAFKGRLIEDDALFAQAGYFEKLEKFELAEANLLQILNVHPESLFIDDSIFRLGLLYRDHLNDSLKAQEMFEKIIFEYPSSIYLVDARKHYRKIRGDDI